ncbi:hypothetical protein BT67DRAFT_130891 [Trichocladium antarcticum]|uniref:Uncharacterized protein n=1 Tax=Trichocladium antarcticum TaxID=1450529 RepID=A0AAN6US67_9PEZI|nr:hypothetical protein BT67DRAFT_130891 [Trichocladium antarcticum]
MCAGIGDRAVGVARFRLETGRNNADHAGWACAGSTAVYGFEVQPELPGFESVEVARGGSIHLAANGSRRQQQAGPQPSSQASLMRFVDYFFPRVPQRLLDPQRENGKTSGQVCQGVDGKPALQHVRHVGHEDVIQKGRFTDAGRGGFTYSAALSGLWAVDVDRRGAVNAQIKPRLRPGWGPGPTCRGNTAQNGRQPKFRSSAHLQAHQRKRRPPGGRSFLALGRPRRNSAAVSGAVGGVWLMM